MTDSEELTCSDCGIVLASGPAAGGEFSEPCPKCGSLQQKLHVSLHDTVEVQAHDLMELKAKNNSYPSKRKLRQHIIMGSEERKSVGDYVEKERVIDKDKDLYREHVVDKDGNVIHSVEESLKKHLGHGSDKFGKKPLNTEESIIDHEDK